MAHPAPYLIKEQLVAMLLEDLKVDYIADALEEAGAYIDDLCTDNHLLVMQLMGYPWPKGDEKADTVINEAMERYNELEEKLKKQYVIRHDRLCEHPKEKEEIMQELGAHVDWLFEQLKELTRKESLN